MTETLASELVTLADQYLDLCRQRFNVPGLSHTNAIKRAEAEAILKIGFLFPQFDAEEKQRLLAANFLKFSIECGTRTNRATMSDGDALKHEKNLHWAEAEYVTIIQQIRESGMLEKLTPVQITIADYWFLTVHLPEPA